MSQSKHVQARASFSCSPSDARMLANLLNAVALGRDPRPVVAADPALFARLSDRIGKARETAERLESYRAHVDALQAKSKAAL